MNTCYEDSIIPKANEDESYFYLNVIKTEKENPNV